MEFCSIAKEKTFRPWRPFDYGNVVIAHGAPIPFGDWKQVSGQSCPGCGLARQSKAMRTSAIKLKSAHVDGERGASTQSIY